MEDRVKCSKWQHDHNTVNIRMDSGTSDASVNFQGSASTLGRVYMLAAANDTDSLGGRILVWASDTGSGTHHIEGTGIIIWGTRYRNRGQPGTKGEEDEVIVLRLGRSLRKVA